MEKIKKEIKTWEERFDKEFVHKGEDGNDPEEKWSWTIKGSYPIEVKSFIAQEIALVRRMTELDIMEKDLENIFHPLK